MSFDKLGDCFERRIYSEFQKKPVTAPEPGQEIEQFSKTIWKKGAQGEYEKAFLLAKRVIYLDRTDNLEELSDGSLQPFLSMCDRIKKHLRDGHEPAENDDISVKKRKGSPSKPSELKKTKMDSTVSGAITGDVRVIEKEEHYRLVLDVPGFTFSPGQYVILHEKGGDQKTWPLAIASGTANANTVEVWQQKKPGKGNNKYFLDELGKRSEVDVQGPFGSHFPVANIGANTPVYLLGGGSGFTALRSVYHSLPNKNQARFIYSAKTKRDLPYRNECLGLSRAGNNVFSLTREKSEDFASGHVTDYLDAIPKDAVVFVCGSVTLIDSVLKGLNKTKHPLDQIYVSLPLTEDQGGPVICAGTPSGKGDGKSLVESSIDHFCNLWKLKKRES